MISQRDKKRFRAIAHQLHPVVTIAGNGLSEGVLAELDRALGDHELIKVRIVGDREARAELSARLLNQTNAELVQGIGGVVVIYRAAEKPNPALSNVLRANVF